MTLLGFLLGAFTVLMPVKTVSAGCRVNCWSRNCALDYGVTAVNEPYRVTHAEWKDDDILSWPGEGVDCSGLVNKTWGMKDNSGSTSFFWWYTEESLPSQTYFARNYYWECNGNGACTKVCDSGSLTACPYSATEPMDAFATLNNPSIDTDDHIGLIYAEESAGLDWILEAFDQQGTEQDGRIVEHSWRIMTGYRGIRRASWSSNYSCSDSTCPFGCPIYLPSIHKVAATPYKILEGSNPYPTPSLSYPYP
jgi:hypothetical protein